jgi:AAA+ ATPase superfamily predicted ATPase
MKRFILVLITLCCCSGLFAESLYYKKYKNGEISLNKENSRYILKTDEIKSDGFNYVTVIDIKYEIMAMEFIYVLENNCKNGNYYDFIEEAYEEDKDELELIDSSVYFKDRNMVMETKYKCDVE